MAKPAFIRLLLKFYFSFKFQDDAAGSKRAKFPSELADADKIAAAAGAPSRARSIVTAPAVCSITVLVPPLATVIALLRINCAFLVHYDFSFDMIIIFMIFYFIFWL